MINYKLIKSSTNDVDRLIEYKKRTIYEYAKDLTNDEIDEINSYVISEVPKSLDDYCNILVNAKIVGCLLLTDRDDGKLLDEIYLEEEYRNKGIGTDIIKRIIDSNKIVYLWVYKENVKAISLYSKLGFIIIDETDTRYYMKYVLMS